MIPPDIYAFLSKLKQNNHREWFQSNKTLYQEAKHKFEIIVEMLINEISQFDPDIKGLQVKDCSFRIYRDVRFSKDKSPYKTNMGAYFCKGGKTVIIFIIIAQATYNTKIFSWLT